MRTLGNGLRRGRRASLAALRAAVLCALPTAVALAA